MNLSRGRRRPMRRLAVAMVALALLAACATQAPLLHDVEFCCGPLDRGEGGPLATYSLKLEAVPAFLAPTLRDALVAALDAKGLQPSQWRPEALITLRFSEVFADADRPLAHDGFGDPLSAPGGASKFDARVTVDVRRAADDALVLRGTLSREHEEAVGEYDHTRDRAQIRDGFAHLLERLPTVARRS